MPLVLALGCEQTTEPRRALDMSARLAESGESSLGSEEILVIDDSVPDSIKHASSTVSAARLGPTAPSFSLAGTLEASATLDVDPAAYTVRAVPFAPELGSLARPGPQCDDCTMIDVPLGFAFTFYGNTYSALNISSNGFVTFGPRPSSSGCCAGDFIPAATAGSAFGTLNLDNLIALAWSDWVPSQAGMIRYETRGTAPARKFVLQFTDVPEFAGSTRLTAQLVLEEGSNAITIYVGSLNPQTGPGHQVTQGIENGNGTAAAFVTGRVRSFYTLGSDGVRFVPGRQAPTAAFGAPAQVNEGADASLVLSAPSDVGARYAFDCGSGFGPIGSANSALCPTADNGRLSVKGRVIDATDDNLYSEYSAEIEVVNVPPTAGFTFDSPVDEGSTFQLRLSDPQDVATDREAGFLYAFDCGSGAYAAPGAATTATCATTDNGGRSVRARITDKDGGWSEYHATVAVDNVAPTATLNAPASVDEGSAIPLSLTDPADASPNDAAAGFQYAFDCGFGYGPLGAASVVWCPTTDNGARVVRARIRDKDLGEREYTAVVAVANVSPVITALALPSDPIAVGTSITLSASFTDAGTGDTHQAIFDLDDGRTAAGTVVGSGGAGSATAVVTYSQAGVYTIRVTVTDDDGGSRSRSSALDMPGYVVVYDPAAGYVTGGGWIASPAGAYAADPSARGDATFGFVSMYLPGAQKPSGNTEFQFTAGSMHFSSTSYEWLVVAGARAQYKGEGSINRTGSYGFLLTAIDGQASGGGGADRFRIKIWDKATGRVVYDNQMGESEDSDAATVLGGGSVVVHR